jgi:Ran GTPase-activating protein (RanGAP) involved in mRNA processing and transport
MEALTKFDISTNSLDAGGAKALAEGLKGNQVITELIISDNDLGYTPGVGTDMSGVVTLADVISDMGALSVLSLKSNSLQAAGGKALAEGLKSNQVITELDISSNSLGLRGYDADNSGIIALADAIPDMRALMSLDISNQVDEDGDGGFGFGAEGAKYLAEALTAHP